LAVSEPKLQFKHYRLENAGEKSPHPATRRRWRRGAAPEQARLAANQFQRRQQTANGPFRQRRTGNKPVTFLKTKIIAR